MSVFTDDELRFLRSRPLLARIATVGAGGTPHVVPTGWSYNPELDAIDVGGRDLTATSPLPIPSSVPRGPSSTS